mmetsp:Transcript_45899/g.82648  ORF Transcript_45899/g.82648 Transcript_45899/m.82648 type:complete len:866 (+) Transcript_45899:51-2648(+)
MAPKEEPATVETKEEEKKEEKKEDKAEAKKEEGEAKAEDVEMKEEPKEPEPPKEQEVDAPADKRAKVKKVSLNFDDSTMNVMPTAGGRLLRTLSEGGMSYLLASVRCDTGIKSGRYLFEARIVENLVDGKHDGSATQPRGLVRLGFSTAGSSLFLGDGPLNCCFDSEGFFVHEKSRKKAGKKFVADNTVGVLLNLDSSSPNANTISLFINGERASQPTPLPQELVGQPLFPTITYKNVSLEVNLGPSLRAELPFKCRMLSTAAAADVETVKQAAAEKQTVVFPVGLPEQGYFDFVDGFAEKAGSTELSDRQILEWAGKSGLWKGKTQSGPAASTDKPEAKFGIPALDDWSVRRVLKAIAPALQRSYIVPELKANLLATEREKALKHFPAQDFKRKAVVVMGEPNADFKARVQKLLLSEKTAKAEAEKKKKAQEAERKRLLELKKKKAEEAKKLKEAAQKKKDGVEVEEAPPAEEKEDVKMEAEEPEAAPELTEEEKKLWYRKTTTADISENALSKAYSSFSLPSKAEGFDEVTFLWQSEADCAALLRKWILEKKLTQRAEDLQPGAGFKESWTKWQKTLQEFKTRQSQYKDPSKRKALQAKKVEAAKKAVAEEKEKLVKAGDEEAANALEAKAVKEAEPKEVDVEELDVFGVTDVMDIGNGAPLFENFQYEDWTMLSTRYEIHLLLHSFKKDLNDPDRPGFTEQHFGYYFNKYFRKSWNLSQFGMEKLTDLLDLMKDTVVVESTGFLKPEQAEDTAVDNFVKLTEDHRRERERRVDAGDETAQLKFTRTVAAGAKGNGKGGGKSAPAPTRPSSYGGGSHSNSSYGAQKRSYQPTVSSSYSASKQPRTSYGSGGYGGGYGGSYGRR